MSAKTKMRYLVTSFLWLGVFVAFFPVRAVIAEEAIPCEPEPNDTTILEYGDIASCSIDPVGDLDRFEFSGVEGEEIILTLSDRSWTYGDNLLDPQMELFDPSGAPIDDCTLTPPNAEGIECHITLPMTGIYTVLVTDLGNNDTGSYSLALQRLFPSPDNALSLCIDCILEESISPVADSDVVLFEGTENDRVILTLSDRSWTYGDNLLDPQMELFDPSGAPIDDCKLTPPNLEGIECRITLPMTGTYTVLVTDSRNNETGNYNLALQRLFPSPDNALSLCIDCILEENISPTADSDVVLFEGTENDSVVLTLSDRSTTYGNDLLDPKMELFDPTGEPVQDPTTGEPLCTLVPPNFQGIECRITLPMTGTYTVLVTDSRNNETGNYNLALQRLFPSPNSALFLCDGCVLEETISPVADSDVILLDGSEGCTARLTLTDKSSTYGNDLLDPKMELFDPTGEPVQDPTTGEPLCMLTPPNLAGETCQLTFSVTGTYTALVTDVSDNETGSYNLALAHLFGTCSAPRPEITVITVPYPLMLMFPDTPVGEESEPEVITVRNDGGAALDIGTIGLLGDDPGDFNLIADNCSGQTLASQATCTIEMSYAPTSAGGKSALLEIPSSDADENPVNVVLRGGTPDEPDIAVTPTAIDFGTVPVDDSSCETVTTRNDGGVLLTIDDLALMGSNGSNSNQFRVDVDNCSGQTLPSMQSCDVSVCFEPTSLGEKSATLEIPSNDPDENPVEVTLRGVGDDVTPSYTLTVNKDGTGSGTVTSTNGEISCGANCSKVYPENTVVTLIATPDADSFFVSWGGDTDCEDGMVTMDTNKTCTAIFNIVIVGDPEISAGQACGALDAEVMVPINLTKNGVPIASVGFTLEFPTEKVLCEDPDHLPTVACSPEALALGFNCTGEPDCETATFQVTVTPPETLPVPELPEGEIARLMFEVDPLADAGDSPLCSIDDPSECMPLSFLVHDCGDTVGLNVSCQAFDGCVDVVGCLQGDCNGDGVVTTADVTCTILRIFDPNRSVPCADCNGDGVVTTADVTCTILCIFGQCPMRL